MPFVHWSWNEWPQQFLIWALLQGGQDCSTVVVVVVSYAFLIFLSDMLVFQLANVSFEKNLNALHLFDTYFNGCFYIKSHFLVFGLQNKTNELYI